LSSEKKGELFKRGWKIGPDRRGKTFGQQNFLQLWVKVKKDWRNKEVMLRNFGYDNKHM
jgi:GTP-binding protein Era